MVATGQGKKISSRLGKIQGVSPVSSREKFKSLKEVKEK